MPLAKHFLIAHSLHHNNRRRAPQPLVHFCNFQFFKFPRPPGACILGGGQASKSLGKRERHSVTSSATSEHDGQASVCLCVSSISIKYLLEHRSLPALQHSSSACSTNNLQSTRVDERPCRRHPDTVIVVVIVVAVVAVR